MAFSSGEVNQVIPDGDPTGITSSIKISGVPFTPSLTTTSVILETYITHPMNQDLRVSLVNPYFTLVSLSTNRGNNYDNAFNGTKWRDDSTANSKLYKFNLSGVVPYLSPETPLSNLLYSPSFNGIWSLTVYDSNYGYVGTLNEWKITIGCKSFTSSSSPFFKFKTKNKQKQKQIN
jgi:subtilisin-like proprotein convertase family protein